MAALAHDLALIILGGMLGCVYAAWQQLRLEARLEDPVKSKEATMDVTMHFGDGTFKNIQVEENDPEEAVQAARDWVADNAWFEATDNQDEVVADTRLT